MVEKKIAGVTCHPNQALVHRFTISLGKEWLDVILLPEITPNSNQVKLKGKYSHLFTASKTGSAVTDVYRRGKQWNEIGRYVAVLGRRPSATRPGKFSRGSRHCAWHHRVHLLGDPPGPRWGCTASLGEGTPPESSSECLPSPQLTSPSQSAHLSFTITLVFVFRLHFEFFQAVCHPEAHAIPSFTRRHSGHSLR